MTIFICFCFLLFSYFCSKHRSLVHVRTASLSTHNRCFRAKIRKNEYPCKPQFSYIKVGCKGVYITRTCWHDYFLAFVAGSFRVAGENYLFERDLSGPPSSFRMLSLLSSELIFISNGFFFLLSVVNVRIKKGHD